jgi:acyl-CoA synthetase (AMP-forming)/AMP-acid ligase II
VYQSNSTLVRALESRADQLGNELAYRFLPGGGAEESVTYSALREQAFEGADCLLQSIRPGCRALLLFPPGLDFIVALFACWVAGLIAVPLPFPKRGQSIDRALHAFDDCTPAVILTSTEAAASLRSDLPVHMASLVRALGSWQALPTFPADLTHAAGDTVLLQYTSGSTSHPKGVRLSDDNLMANLEQIRKAFAHTRESVGVIWLPHYHDMGLIGGILQPLHVGFPVTLFSPIAFLQRPMRWLEAISKYRATTSGGPCFGYDLCVEKARKGQIDPSLDLSSWTVAFNGAEPVRASSLRQFASTFSRCGFSSRSFVACYGLAEATLLVTSTPVGLGVTHDTPEQETGTTDQPLRQLVSCGVPAEGVSIEIINAATGEPCNAGSIGEIQVSGPAVSQGYWNEGCAAAGSAQHRLRTGDLGFIKGSELFVSGRLKDLIILRGRNIFPEDIEETMRSACPELALEGCAAISVDGPDGEELVLLQEVSARHLRTHSTDAIRSAVTEAVSRICGVRPMDYLAVPVGKLTRTSSGKISRFSCKQLYLASGLSPARHLAM